MPTPEIREQTYLTRSLSLLVTSGGVLHSHRMMTQGDSGSPESLSLRNFITKTSGDLVSRTHGQSLYGCLEKNNSRVTESPRNFGSSVSQSSMMLRSDQQLPEE
eukprot:767009-Hanusia_phi.AAC.8